MEIEAFQEPLCLAGLLLTHQAGICAHGDVPGPLVGFVCESAPPVVNAIQVKEETPDSSVTLAAAQMHLEKLKDELDEFCSWSVVCDADLDSAGRVLLVEVGCRQCEWSISLAQRYRPASERAEFALIGKIELVGLEYLPDEFRRNLAGSPWQDWMKEGTRDESAEPEWRKWSARRLDPGIGNRYRLGPYRFTCPVGWIARSAMDGPGWRFVRLLPLAKRGREPVIILALIGADKQVVADFLDATSGTREAGREILQSATIEVRPGLTAAQQLVGYDDGSRGRYTYLPAEYPGSFVMAGVITLELEGWQQSEWACAELLRSLEIMSETGDGPSRSPDGRPDNSP